MKLVTVAEMMELERGAGVSVPQLMENAGLAVAQEVWLLLGEVAERSLLVLVGPGNNGGDGLVAARHLHDWGAKVQLYLLKARSEDDPVFAQVVERQLPLTLAEEDAKAGFEGLKEALARAEVVIDALLGTGRARLPDGQARPIEGTLAEVLERLKEARSKPLPPRLLAMDLPSGVDADTGTVDPHCVAADVTATLAWSKVGLHTLPAAQYTGRIEVVDIGIPKALETALPTELMTEGWARSLLPGRPAAAHKGSFGKALVVAGSPNYTGAAYLAAAGATRVGAGLVTLACARTIYPILAAKLVETTFIALPDEEGHLSAEAAHAVRQALGEGYDALLVGCGLGQGGYVRAFLRSLLPLLKETPVRGMVLDADGLNNLAGVEEWWQELGVPTVVTPHPGEMSRLWGTSTEEIQAQRLKVAQEAAKRWGVAVALKGAHTVVTAPDGRARLPDGQARISPFANPGLASAGTGDVLAGAIAGFMAQGLDPFDAASLATFVHGLAGERLRRELGSAGMVAGDLLLELPRAIKELRRE